MKAGRKSIKVGNTVVVKLYDNREMVARVDAISETVAGRKLNISFAMSAFRVDAAQILKVLT